MRRLIITLAIVVLVAITLLASSNAAWRAAQSKATGDCGCSTACMGGKSCAINCPTGKAAHCDCEGGSEHAPQQAKCYCRLAAAVGKVLRRSRLEVNRHHSDCHLCATHVDSR